MRLKRMGSWETAPSALTSSRRAILTNSPTATRSSVPTGGRGGERTLAVLEARGVLVNERVRTASLGCADGLRLKQWLARATSAARANDVVGE